MAAGILRASFYLGARVLGRAAVCATGRAGKYRERDAQTSNRHACLQRALIERPVTASLVLMIRRPEFPQPAPVSGARESVPACDAGRLLWSGSGWFERQRRGRRPRCHLRDAREVRGCHIDRDRAAFEGGQHAGVAKTCCAAAGVMVRMLISAAAAAMIRVIRVGGRLYRAEGRRVDVKRRVMRQDGDQQNDQGHRMRKGSPNEGTPHARDIWLSAHACFPLANLPEVLIRRSLSSTYNLSRTRQGPATAGSRAWDRHPMRGQLGAESASRIGQGNCSSGEHALVMLASARSSFLKLAILPRTS